MRYTFVKQSLYELQFKLDWIQYLKLFHAMLEMLPTEHYTDSLHNL